jgi:hypothetical protein
MRNEYLKDGVLDLVQLRHDLNSLVEPFALSMKIMDSEKREKAIFLQAEVLRKLKAIVAELAATGEDKAPADRKGCKV